MKITEIRIKLVNGDAAKQRLRAFCSITFDHSFVVRDLKILEGDQGFFVSMPSRKITFRCPQCRQKNPVGFNFCSSCGRSIRDSDPYASMIAKAPYKAYLDIVHPINSQFREYIHETIISAYNREKELSLLPGYTPSYDDYFNE